MATYSIHVVRRVTRRRPFSIPHLRLLDCCSHGAGQRGRMGRPEVAARTCWWALGVRRASLRPQSSAQARRCAAGSEFSRGGGARGPTCVRSARASSGAPRARRCRSAGARSRTRVSLERSLLSLGRGATASNWAMMDDRPGGRGRRRAA